MVFVFHDPRKLRLFLMMLSIENVYFEEKKAVGDKGNAVVVRVPDLKDEEKAKKIMKDVLNVEKDMWTTVLVHAKEKEK